MSEGYSDQYRKARRLALETWQRRREWLEVALSWWNSEACNSGDPEAWSTKRMIDERLSLANQMERHYEHANASVHGYWLKKAMFDFHENG